MKTPAREATFGDRMSLNDFKATSPEERAAGAARFITIGQTNGTVTVEVDLVKLWASLGPRAIRLKNHKVTRCHGAITIVATDVTKVARKE